MCCGFGVGRLAFPIFAFVLAEGFRLTHSRRRYLLCLVLFALLAELPFDGMAGGQWVDWSGQNVLWTLALGLCAMACVQRAPREPGLAFLAWLSAAAGCCLLGELLNTDYGAFGVLLCLLFYCTDGLRGRFWVCGGIFFLMCYGFRFVFLPGIPVPLEAPGAPVLLAPPGAVWLLLVLPFAHAAFGAILLAGNMALTAMDHGPNGRNHRHQTTLLIPGKGRWQPGPGCSPGWA